MRKELFMDHITSSYPSLNGDISVSFTKEVITSGNKEVIVCNHDKFEVRLIRLEAAQNEDKSAKILFNATIKSKLSEIIIHAPVVLVTRGDHAGSVLIGRTANFKKHRALLSKYISEDKVFDEVTIPYPDYMVIETMLRKVVAEV